MEFINQFSGWGSWALMLSLGIVFIVHGMAKWRNPDMVAGVWGGSRTLGKLHGFIEIVAALAVATGVGAFWGAWIMVVVMLGAIYYKVFRWKVPFMAPSGTGWEFDLVILAGALALIFG